MTPEGAVFLAEARAVVQRADRAADVARALAEGATGRLRLSYVVTVSGGLPEPIVSEYRGRYPSVELTADSGSTAHNAERLAAGALDVAFVHPPFEDGAGLGWVEVATEPLVVAVPSAHRLSRRRRLRREDLTGVPLVYFPRHYSPGVYDSGLSQVYGAEAPDIVRTEPTGERVLVAVSEGAGISLVVEEQAAALRHPGVTFRRFADPEPTVALAVAFPPHPPAGGPPLRRARPGAGAPPEAGPAPAPVGQRHP